MNNRERWNSLTEEQQLEIRAERQKNKKLAKELRNSDEVLTEEEKAFVEEHRAKPKSERKRLGLGYWGKKKKATKVHNEKYTINHAKALQIAASRIRNSSKIACIDVEKFMYNDRITEVGITLVQDGKVKPLHYIIKENYKYRNKTNVCDLEDNKDGFIFDDSIHISIDELPGILLEHTTDALVIGHAFSNDMKFLKDHFTFNRDNILDTQRVAKYYYKVSHTIGLKTLLTDFNIDYEGLHNAGNDAYYTLKVMEHMVKEVAHA